MWIIKILDGKYVIIEFRGEICNFLIFEWYTWNPPQKKPPLTRTRTRTRLPVPALPYPCYPDPPTRLPVPHYLKFEFKKKNVFISLDSDLCPLIVKTVQICNIFV